jgi:IclR family KDG regulon transcriptional repressor
MSRNYRVPMVEYTLRIIKALSETTTDLSLKEVSERTHVGRTSAFRILFTLKQWEYVCRNPSTGKYRLSAKLAELVLKPVSQKSVVHLARPILEQLHTRFDETTNLAVYQDGEVIYVEIMESRQPFRMTAEVGARVPIHSTALGKAIAAFLPSDVLSAKLSEYQWTRFTHRTLIGVEKFSKALEAVRKNGYAIDNEETEIGACCIAAPILDPDGHAVGAISLSGPSHRIRRRKREIIRALTKSCNNLSDLLGMK